MSDTKPKTVFDERDRLRAENARLRAELELARRVADAAAATYITNRASHKVWRLDRAALDAVNMLDLAEHEAMATFDAAVRAYRAGVEAAAFMAQPGVRGPLEKLGEMEEEK